MITYAKNRVKEYLQDNNWNAVKDARNREAFYKNRSPLTVGENSFLNYSKPKNQITFRGLIDSIKVHFNDYATTEPLEVISGSEPFFITSGIQRYTSQFSSSANLQIPKSIQLQPVIRTNYRESVGEGNISSFVNISTMAAPVSADKYVMMVDGWMNFFSSQGLFMPDFNITLNEKVPKKTNNPWDANEGFTLSFDYGGLGIGDFGFIMTPKHLEEPIADLGIGLERLVWARNKNHSFGEVIGPLPEGFSPDMKYLDALRTMTLMAIKGPIDEVNAENQLRKYLPRVLDSKSLSLIEGISFYYNFWKDFNPSVKPLQEVQKYLVEEVNREKNTLLLKNLKQPKLAEKFSQKLGLDRGYFIQLLIDSGCINIDNLRSNLMS